MRRRTFVIASTTALGAVALGRFGGRDAAEAGPVTTDALGDHVQTLPAGQLPEFARPAEVQQLYRYAVEHGDDLRYIPCFCGCYRFGHKSNRDCNVKAVKPDGSITYTSHAAT